MSFSIVDALIYLLNVVPLSLITIISVCRINALWPCAPRTLKLSYIFIATGAFWRLLTTQYGSDFNQQAALFVVGVAMVLMFERRKAPVCDVASERRRSIA